MAYRVETTKNDGDRFGHSEIRMKNDSVSEPTAPYLTVSVERGFSVTFVRVAQVTATVQAFDDGCYDNTYFYDRTSTAWFVAAAELTRRPTAADRNPPWTRVPVRITLGSPTAHPVAEVVDDLLRILDTDNEFVEYLSRSVSLVDFRRELTGCATAEQLIALIGRVVPDE